jgi:hypothetical protein
LGQNVIDPTIKAVYKEGGIKNKPRKFHREGRLEMSKPAGKRKLVGPWRDIHGAIWLIGLGILFWKGWWWPGILILLGLSGILEALIMLYVPRSYEEEIPAGTPPPAAPPVADAPVTPAPVSEHRLELLPSICPMCGGPLRGHEVKWTGPRSADCPYCGSNLPMVEPGL